jgi:DNA anti-recombination protein RmuC
MELKYIVSTRVALAGAAAVMNQEFTKVKIERLVMRVDHLEEKLEQMDKNMGQRVDRLEEKLEQMDKNMGQWVDRMEEKLDNMEKKMDEKFDRMEQKMDKVLIQQFVPNSWPWSNGCR